jgi:hypothetical protein
MPETRHSESQKLEPSESKDPDKELHRERQLDSPEELLHLDLEDPDVPPLEEQDTSERLLP